MPPTFVLDPNIVYLILIVGLWCGVTAAYAPGTGIIEAGAAIITGVGVYLLTLLPTNWFAVLILMVGMAGFLFVPLVDARLAWAALLGLLMQALAALFMVGVFGVSPALVLLVALVSFAYFQFMLLPALTRQRTLAREAHTDLARYSDDALLGASGRVVRAIDGGVGAVRVGGDTWSARAERALEPGDEVVVVEREGLILTVEGVKHKNQPAG